MRNKDITQYTELERIACGLLLMSGVLNEQQLHDFFNVNKSTSNAWKNAILKMPVTILLKELLELNADDGMSDEERNMLAVQLFFKSRKD